MIAIEITFRQTVNSNNHFVTFAFKTQWSYISVALCCYDPMKIDKFQNSILKEFHTVSQ